MIDRSRHSIRLFALALLLAGTVAACAAEPPAEEAGLAAVEPTDDDAVSDAPPEVFFVNVDDGGTYTSPLDLVFGVENFAIVPVETPPAVRPGEGHYHLAVDIACAAAGEVIVQGNPSYIHFGSGADTITMQFEPGEHTLCLQVADGEHRVIDGPTHSALTKEITITVEE